MMWYADASMTDWQRGTDSVVAAAVSLCSKKQLRHWSILHHSVLHIAAQTQSGAGPQEQGILQYAQMACPDTSSFR